MPVQNFALNFPCYFCRNMTPGPMSTLIFLSTAQKKPFKKSKFFRFHVGVKWRNPIGSWRKLQKFLHVSYFFFFILLLFLHFFFLDFLSDKISRKCSSYESFSDEIANGIQDYKQEHIIIIIRSERTHILISFGEIIRFTAANFLVFFALPWVIKWSVKGTTLK